MDFTVATVHPERQPGCPACAYQRAEGWLPDDDPTVDHTCRTAPATPRSTIEAQLHAARRVFADRELRIRKERLADLRLARGSR